MRPDTGPEPDPVGTEPHPQIDATVALLDRIGDAVLLTHSLSGRYGFLTGIRSRHVAAIVSYEPSRFPYRNDREPAGVAAPVDPTVEHITSPILVDPDLLERLADIPIQIVFGDNLPRDPQHPSPYPGIDLWRAVTIRAEQFAEQVNGLGGRVEIFHLPDAGLTGNSHFPFSDLNNLAVADLLSEFLARHRLDGR